MPTASFCAFAPQTLLVDGKLTVLSLFSLRFIFREYADSSNQRDFFSFRAKNAICPIKLVEHACPPQKLCDTSKLFLQSSSLFLRARVCSLLNKQSTFAPYHLREFRNLHFVNARANLMCTVA